MAEARIFSAEPSSRAALIAARLIRSKLAAIAGAIFRRHFSHVTDESRGFLGDHRVITGRDFAPIGMQSGADLVS